MAYCLLHWFYLATLGCLSAALLFDNAVAPLIVLTLASAWLLVERYRNRQSHDAGWGTSAFHFKLLAWASKLDVFINRLSRGSLLGESGRAHIARICVSSLGAKSRQNRIVPIMRYRIRNMDALPCSGEVVAGSYNGAEKHPAWVHNFRAAARNADPVVYNKGPSIYHAVIKEIVDSGERAALLQEMNSANPGLAEKQSRTAREIPLFVLHPLGEWRWEEAPAEWVARLTPKTGPLGTALIALADWF